MKVFVDTNVVIDYMLQREHSDMAKKVIDRLLDSCEELFISSGSFYTLLYVIDKHLRKEFRMEKTVRLAFVRSVAHGILKDYRVAAHDNETLLRSVDDLRFSDLEDSCQLQAAIVAGCDYLLTFNTGDYPAKAEQKPVVLTPEEFYDDVSC